MTIAYLERASARPGMHMVDFDLTVLEAQLHGYDTALSDSGTLGECDRFNRTFADFLSSTKGLSTSQGWAKALLRCHRSSEAAFKEFVVLLKATIPGFAHGPCLPAQ